MEKGNLSLLYKSRSYGACIKAGYNLYTDNFRKLFKSTWIIAAIIAIVEGLTKTLDTLHVAPVAVAVGIIIEAICAVALFGTIIYIFNQHAVNDEITKVSLKKESKDILHDSIRVLKTIIWQLLLIMPIVAAYLFYAKMTTGHSLSDPYVHKYMIMLFFVFVICIILYMPFNYLIMKYCVGDKIHSWNVITKGYKVGFRHWGFIFAVLFITGIITAVVVLIVNTPHFVILGAKGLSDLGVMQGDPSGLPPFFSVLLFFVFAITTFIGQYVEMAMLFPVYYMYGSIETQEKEKADFENNIQQ